MKNCGSCKWLSVQPHHLKKDGTTKERYRFSMFLCTVPFEAQQVPACIEVKLNDRRYMAPYYGTECSFHEPRK